MKYLFWLVVILVVVFFYRNAVANAQRGRMQERNTNSNAGGAKKGAKPEGSRRFGHAGRAARNEGIKTITMVQCEHCHTHLPEDEALIRYGHAWCNEDHERLGPEK